MKKIFIVTKWIKAESILEVLQKERNTPPADISISERWLNNDSPNLHRMVGMRMRKTDEDDDDSDDPDRKR